MEDRVSEWGVHADETRMHTHQQLPGMLCEDGDQTRGAN